MKITKTAKNQKLHFDQHQLYILSYKIGQNIVHLNHILNLQLKTSNNKRFYGCCPVHGGDNNRALTIYDNGIWKCRSHQCHNVFTSSLVGFIRGVLSHNTLMWTKLNDRTVSLQATIQYLDSIGISTNNRLSSRELLYANIIKYVSHAHIEPIQKHKLFSKHNITKFLQIPAPSFIPKYNSDILIKYDIGLCRAKYKKMSNRVVAPIYDENYEYGVACTGRTVYPKCNKCETYHYSHLPCNTKNKHHAKWLSVGLDSKKFLYNYWFAKSYIKQQRSILIVESVGNVLKLVQNKINNVVGIFGTNISQHQYNIIVRSGALYLNVLLDNDDGGSKGLDATITQFENVMKINIIKLDTQYNDISDAPDTYVESEIIPQLKDYVI